MSRSFGFLFLPTDPPRRRGAFAIRALDAVTLETVWRGLKVVAEGIKGTPTVNASGLFVWLEEDLNPLTRVTIDPGPLSYEAVVRERTQLQLPPGPLVTTIELPPRVDYPFPIGITALRSTLIERRVVAPERAQPVQDAEVWLLWQDDVSGEWKDAPTRSHTNREGDFASILRLAPDQVAHTTSPGTVDVRLRVRRDGLGQRTSDTFSLNEGRLTEPTPSKPVSFAWDELLP